MVVKRPSTSRLAADPVLQTVASHMSFTLSRVSSQKPVAIKDSRTANSDGVKARVVNGFWELSTPDLYVSLNCDILCRYLKMTHQPSPRVSMAFLEAIFMEKLCVRLQIPPESAITVLRSLRSTPTRGARQNRNALEQ